MPRNAEVIRQWSILKELEASRRVTIDDLALRSGVTTRTIRRDLEALQTAGSRFSTKHTTGRSSGGSSRRPSDGWMTPPSRWRS